MKPSAKVLIACAAALGCASCALQVTPESSMKGLTPARLASMDLWQARTMANGTPLDPKSCDFKDSKGKDQCRIDVTMSFAGDVCTAEVAGFLTVPKKKVPTIVWTIKKKLADIQEDVSFPEWYGIAIVSDEDEQIFPGRKPGKGGVGDGDKSTDPIQFCWENKNGKANRTRIKDTIYLPVVQWKKKQSNGTINLMLCRAIDPRIVNEGD